MLYFVVYLENNSETYIYMRFIEVKKIKNIANMITLIRIIGAFSLLLFKLLSPIFLFLYVVCGISDILGGYIARTTSALEELLISMKSKELNRDIKCIFCLCMSGK